MRILVVEDDRRLSELLRRGLIGEGFAVDLAYEGPRGLDLAMENAYDAAVVDVMLPGLNGFRLCARLRAAGVWTPVLMLTAKDGEYDEAEGLDTGADDYVTKPFSFVALTARLRALIRRGQRERPAAFAVGDLHVDPAARRCRRGEAVLTLTAREFSGLESLAVVAQGLGDDGEGDACGEGEGEGGGEVTQVVQGDAGDPASLARLRNRSRTVWGRSGCPSGRQKTKPVNRSDGSPVSMRVVAAWCSRASMTRGERATQFLLARVLSVVMTRRVLLTADRG
ncbi:Sensor histidine kinase RcsC [Streptomyces antimycoticus]